MIRGWRDEFMFPVGIDLAITGASMTPSRYALCSMRLGISASGTALIGSGAGGGMPTNLSAGL